MNLSKYDGYLTEQKLGDVLKQIFPNNVVQSQYRLYKKKFDYAIVDKYENFPEFFPVLKIFDESFTGEDLDDKEIREIYNKPITVLFEFDGYRHYNNNHQVIKDYELTSISINGTNNWLEIDSNVFLVRIPYFVQLDSYISEKIFGIAFNFTDFPHGFVDRKALTPASFSNYGEKRFLSEVRNLPLEVSQKILENLKQRIDKDGIHSIISIELLESVIQTLEPDSAKKLDEMRKLCPDVYKHYKYFNIEEIDELIQVLYFEGFRHFFKL